MSLHQSYYEKVAHSLRDTLSRTTLPVQLTLNNDHTITVSLHGVSEKVTLLDNVIGAYYHRIYKQCITDDEKAQIKHIIETVSDVLWTIPKEHWLAFCKIARALL